MADARRILRKILSGYEDADKWVDSPFERIKRLSNTKVGDVGQEFVETLCGELGFDCAFPLDSRGRRARNSPWDIRIENITFELKTATEDVHDAFQFNHIRYHRDYEALLCVGIRSCRDRVRCLVESGGSHRESGAPGHDGQGVVGDS